MPISERRHDLGRYNPSGHPAWRALCAVRRRASAGLRHHAAGEPCPWRSHRDGRLPDSSPRDDDWGCRPLSPRPSQFRSCSCLGYGLQKYMLNRTFWARIFCRRCWSPSGCLWCSRTLCWKGFQRRQSAPANRRDFHRLASIGGVNLGVMPLLTFASAVAGDRRAQPAFLSHRAWAGLPGDLGRCNDGEPDGHQAPAISLPRPRASP
jgi:hypothetical protein